MRQVALALCLMSLGPAAARAQEPPRREAPPTVRVRLRSLDTVQGYLRGRSKDEVVVFTSEGQYRHLPVADIQRFEVRSRTGSHLKRGALLGVLAWGSVMAAAALTTLDKAGVASWQSGAILAGGVGLGSVIGSQVPRYGWRVSDPRAAAAPPPAPLAVRIAVKF